ncbi:MAG: hypothetical protein HKP12_04195 [Gammaproteobacteria bacterium]|nr:hypothetical protein [Gammaproteobacteria bacterium]
MSVHCESVGRVYDAGSDGTLVSACLFFDAFAASAIEIIDVPCMIISIATNMPITHRHDTGHCAMIMIASTTEA